MNLNSYIGLMGGSYQEVATPLGTALVPCAPRLRPTSPCPTPTTCSRSTPTACCCPSTACGSLYLLEQSAHADVGVAQTPYSSYPGSATRIERIAGATTDLQHIVHQGMTHYDATFWVGANAVLRKRALDDIVEIDYEGDWEIRRYIQDRTVIEDTESTIDLGIHGWTLLNYPERLTYSATPPDFGSLCIQRQRWANGGLLILPKLRQQSRARQARGERNRFGEVFLRVNYMASIFWASICLLVLLAYPFNSRPAEPDPAARSPLPYFVMMASDLRYCGYKRLDVLRIYGFNLILLPVNLSGTLRLDPAAGDRREERRSSARPKVRNRTTARAIFILAPLRCSSPSPPTRSWWTCSVHQWEQPRLRRAERGARASTPWSPSSASATASSTSGCSCAAGCTSPYRPRSGRTVADHRRRPTSGRHRRLGVGAALRHRRRGETAVIAGSDQPLGGAADGAVAQAARRAGRARPSTQRFGVVRGVHVLHASSSRSSTCRPRPAGRLRGPHPLRRRPVTAGQPSPTPRPCRRRRGARRRAGPRGPGAAAGSLPAGAWVSVNVSPGLAGHAATSLEGIARRGPVPGGGGGTMPTWTWRPLLAGPLADAARRD